ncbi:hypothetical protein JCM30566_10690 [Marinitoga arctica]
MKGLEKIIIESPTVYFNEDIYTFFEEWIKKTKMFIFSYMITQKFKIYILYNKNEFGEKIDLIKNNDNIIKMNFTHNNIDGIFMIEFGEKIDSIERGIILTYVKSLFLSFEAIKFSTEINKTSKSIIYTLSEIIEKRSHETGKHVKNVAEFSYILGKGYGFDDKKLENLKLSAPLHDIGKIGISDDILKKPGKLTEEEFEIMKEHTIIGYKILRDSNWDIFKIAANISLQHHENWDGSGYPYGLKGDSILLEARIVALTDVFDALTQDRIYSKAWDLNDAIKYINDLKGIKFDPDLVEIFNNNIDEIYKLKK